MILEKRRSDLTRQAAHALSEASRYPRRAWEKGREQLPSRLPDSMTTSSGTAIATFAALGLLVVAAGIYFGPDLVRYVKIKRM